MGTTLTSWKLPIGSAKAHRPKYIAVNIQPLLYPKCRTTRFNTVCSHLDTVLADSIKQQLKEKPNRTNTTSNSTLGF